MGGREKSLDALRHGAEHQSPLAAQGEPVSTDEHAETARVDEVDTGDIDHEIVRTAPDRLDEGRSDIGHGAGRQPAAYAQQRAGRLDRDLEIVALEVNGGGLHDTRHGKGLPMAAGLPVIV